MIAGTRHASQAVAAYDGKAKRGFGFLTVVPAPGPRAGIGHPLNIGAGLGSLKGWRDGGFACRTAQPEEGRQHADDRGDATHS
jgi:hypothetical protein